MKYKDEGGRLVKAIALLPGKYREVLLRYIPIYCFVITLAFAIIALTSDSGFFLGGNVIAALVWCIIGVCFLIGYALAIFTYLK